MGKNKFTVGDDVYVVDSKERNGTKIQIIKKRFNAYTADSNYDKASLTDDTNLVVIVQSYAIFATKDDAAKFAIVYLVDTKEPHVEINKEKDVEEQYSFIEESHPELILKYMKNIINL